MNPLTERLQTALGDTYRVERELGGGGMSRVFVAEELELGRRVVVKVLPPEMAAGVNADRFRREIQLAASLQHPHIVPLLRAGRADDLVWYTMPLVEGESLRARLARQGELPVPEVVRILRDVASALAYAHQHGVVHRDIKPDNILLSHQFAVVTDFGVAKAVSEATGQSSLTSVGVALGTPAYMAPEQASADPHTDHRADIYALGVIAYEMLTGRPPFAGLSPQMVLAAHVTQAPEPVTQHRGAVPPALAAVVARCLEKKPADRYQVAADLYQQLDAMATPSGGMTPTGAVPATVATPVPRSRARWLTAGLGALAILAVAVAGLVTVLRRPPAATSAPAAPAAAAARPAGSGGRPTVIVLPFQNLGPPAEEYFADGMTEEITSRLAGVSGLGVISRTSAARYKQSDRSVREIGEAVGAQFVLEGTVRWQRAGRDASRVRISAQLIRVSDDTHLWAQSYDGDLTEVFRVQSEVAQQVAQALDVALLAREDTALSRRPTGNAEAYDAYLQGNASLRGTYTEEGARRALAQYQRAVRLDSSFALAWAWMSRAHAQMFWFAYDPSAERMRQAKAAADRSLALDSALPDAHVALAYYHYWGSRNYQEALQSLETARRLRPGDPEVYFAMANVKRRLGQFSESIQDRERGLSLDPNNATEMLETASTYFAVAREEDAVRYADRVAALAPGNGTPLLMKAAIAFHQADTASARRILRSGNIAESLRDPTDIYGFLYGRQLAGLDSLVDEAVLGSATPEDPLAAYPAHLSRALVHRYRGDSAQARATFDSARVLLEPLVRRFPNRESLWSDLGLVYAGLGRRDEAVRAADRSVALLPVSRDAFLGPFLAQTRAVVLAWTGDAAGAIRQLEALINLPSQGEPVTGRFLGISPAFRSLRRNPGFERLVERRD